MIIFLVTLSSTVLLKVDLFVSSTVDDIVLTMALLQIHGCGVPPSSLANLLGSVR
jgi:hypothetical protein